MMLHAESDADLFPVAAHELELFVDVLHGVLDDADAVLDLVDERLTIQCEPQRLTNHRIRNARVCDVEIVVVVGVARLPRNRVPRSAWMRARYAPLN